MHSSFYIRINTSTIQIYTNMLLQTNDGVNKRIHRHENTAADVQCADKETMKIR